MSAEGAGFSIDPAAVRAWKRYPEYKDSGVEWLGEVPAGWEIIRSKYCMKISMGQSPSSETCNLEGIGTPFLQGTAEFGVIHPEPRQYCSIAPKAALKGEILVSVRAPVGSLNIADQKYGIGRGLCSITPKVNLERVFAWYLLHYVRVQLNREALGSIYEAVAVGDIGNLICSLPPLSEQYAIAAFLDRETARIDALIERKQRFIELLEEKQQALITQTVTKGLNPDVEMKDSGVEWLGEVPAGWDVLPLSVRYHVQLGKMLDKKQISGDHLAPYLRNANIQWGKVDLSELYEMDFTSSERDYYSLNLGDLLVCEGGEIGRTAIWNGELDECYYQKAVHRVRPRSQRDNSRYFYYVMVAAARIGAFDAGADVSTIRHLTAIKLRKMRFAFPPGDEQSRIVGYLDSLHSGYESLRASTKASIEKLHEYRTALISVAVTGKIDVRGEEAA